MGGGGRAIHEYAGKVGPKLVPGYAGDSLDGQQIFSRYVPRAVFHAQPMHAAYTYLPRRFIRRDTLAFSPFPKCFHARQLPSW